VRQRIYRGERFVGFFVVLGFFLLGVLVAQRVFRLFEETRSARFYIANATSVRAGADVTIAGVVAGLVERVDYIPAHDPRHAAIPEVERAAGNCIEVTIKIAEEFVAIVRDDARVRYTKKMGGLGPLGADIEILPGEGDALLEDGAYLPVVPGESLVEEIIAQVAERTAPIFAMIDENRASVAGILHRVDAELLPSVARIIDRFDRETHPTLQALLEELRREEVIAEARRSLATLNEEVLPPLGGLLANAEPHVDPLLRGAEGFIAALARLGGSAARIVDAVNAQLVPPVGRIVARFEAETQPELGGVVRDFREARLFEEAGGLVAEARAGLLAELAAAVHAVNARLDGIVGNVERVTGALAASDAHLQGVVRNLDEATASLPARVGEAGETIYEIRRLVTSAQRVWPLAAVSRERPRKKVTLKAVYREPLDDEAPAAAPGGNHGAR
jgi:ABC-type transporter Mla subunit MlaD